MSGPHRLLALAADWGRTDAERRHRASLFAALRRAGMTAELLVLGTDPFNAEALGNWAGVSGRQARLEDAGSLVAQTAVLRSVVKAGVTFAWGLDEAGNQASRVAQALDRTVTRLVTAGPRGGGGGGLKRRLAELMSRDPNLTIGRSGALAGRDTLDLAPGLDLAQLRRHSPQQVAVMLRRQEGIGPDDTLLVGAASTPTGTDRIVAVDRALRDRGANPAWLWLGAAPAPDGLRLLTGTGDEVGGDLPLLSVAHAAILPDPDLPSRLTARESLALGRPALLAADAPDLDPSVGALPLPVGAAETADLVLSLGEDADRSARGWAKAKAEWPVAEEARRLLATLLPTEKRRPDERGLPD